MPFVEVVPSRKALPAKVATKVAPGTAVAEGETRQLACPEVSVVAVQRVTPPEEKVMVSPLGAPKDPLDIWVMRLQAFWDPTHIAAGAETVA